MPIFLPGMQSILLQSKYIETSSTASIGDTQTTYQKIPDTELIITTQGNSRLLATFTGEGSLTVDGSLVGAVNFYVAIVIEGVSNRTMRIHFYDGIGYGAIREFAISLYNTYQTSYLPAGTYTVSVYWKSGADVTGTNSLNLSSLVGNRTRGLLVQELL